MHSQEIVVKPERITLKDGRKGFFFQAKVKAGSLVVIKNISKDRNLKLKRSPKTTSRLGQSILASLKEVKSRRSKKNYPSKSFDTLMDEL